MSGLFYRVNNSVEAVVPVNEVKEPKVSGDAEFAQREGMVERAKNLSLGNNRLLNKAVDFQIRQDEAQIQALKNPWYSFIIKLAGFSNEDITKFWKDMGTGKDKSQPLANTPNVAQMSQINAAVEQGNEGDDRELGNYLKERQYFLQSVEVRGYLFLTPTCYAHVCEAISLLEKRCRQKINPDELIQSEHSTYFARLVSLRIQMSRFLSGRYYALSANYGRMRTQEAHLIQYFQKELGNNGLRTRAYGSSSSAGLFARLEGL
jgi:hypothetical protein